MDVVGPLECSKAGYQFMLVITDYATRYAEVFALKAVKARTVATCLVQLFLRTDGLTERLNQTLKQMRGIFVSETGADWDNWLPYLLFAYRELEAVTRRLAAQRQSLTPCEQNIKAFSTPSVDHLAK
ncbi:L _3 protein [Solea senegalensis]|uniref:L _3 protein n=1 Tax=Solea senegalensis TaxID=28829 RepID=A0AAV6RXJ6_SOLSE|nr:L _3 protein [Solea senegalensis]